MLKIIAVIFRSLIGIIVLAIAVAIFQGLVLTRPSAAQSTDREAPVIIEALRVTRVPVPVVWQGYGTARPLDAANIAAEVSGRVVERPPGVEPGSKVNRGDLLIRIDPTVFESRRDSVLRQIDALLADRSAIETEQTSLREQVTLTEEQIDATRRDLERAREAFTMGSGSQSEIDQRLQSLQRELVALEALRERLARIPARQASLDAQTASRRADLRLAEYDLERTEVRAPFAGTLQSVSPEPGEFIREGATVARVVDLSRIEIPVILPVSAAPTLAPGDTAVLRPDGPARSAWRGQIARVAPEADASLRSITVFVEVEQDAAALAGSADLLKPGTFLTAEILSSRVEPALVIPRRVISIDRVLVAEPIAADVLERMAAPTGNGSLPRIDITKAAAPTRIREAAVNVERSLETPLPSVLAGERQWAVLTEPRTQPAGALPGQGLREGDLVLLSQLPSLRPDVVVDVRIVGDEPVDAAASATGPDGDAS
ncbi:MAG: HlyD family efflux transporter periplasmic adaptor subunit [Planctomycetota bacterium]